MVEHWRVDGAVHEDENSVRGRGNGGVLDFRHNEVVVRLEDGAGGHGGVEYYDGFLVVVYGLDFVTTGGSEEEEVGGRAVENAAELGGAAAVVNAEGIVNGNVVAESAAERAGGCQEL